MGSLENKGGVFAATKDENTVMSVKKEQKMAEEIKAYVENFLANKYKRVPQIDVLKKSVKFKAFLDDGIISEEEFNEKRKQLLGI